LVSKQNAAIRTVIADCRITLSQLTGVTMIEYDRPPSELVGLIVSPSKRFTPGQVGVGVFLRDRVKEGSAAILGHPMFRLTPDAIARVRKFLLEAEHVPLDQDRISSVVAVIDKTGKMDLVSSRVALDWPELLAVLPRAALA
jgi:hypothetical protein